MNWFSRLFKGTYSVFFLTLLDAALLEANTEVDKSKKLKAPEKDLIKAFLAEFANNLKSRVNTEL